MQWFFITNYMQICQFFVNKQKLVVWYILCLVAFTKKVTMDTYFLAKRIATITAIMGVAVFAENG
jgi:hypothetical protein